MNRKRQWIDRSLRGLTWLSALVAAFMLINILVYIARTGYSTLSWGLLTRDYYAQNMNADFPATAVAGNFPKPANLGADVAYSSKFGLGLKEGLDERKRRFQQIVYLAPDSPLKTASITTAGRKGEERGLQVGDELKRLVFLKADGHEGRVGILAGKNAAKTVQALDKEAVQVKNYYAQVTGGGIRGALIATLMLIGLTLLMALPLGIAAALYLHELAPKNKLTAALRSSIEVLAGVPSIIFGLMGMTLLYPITKLFGLTGQSIVLGAMTLSVVLLPVIIRQTEEALKAVPQSLRDASLALGATRSQGIFKVVLPNAVGGILSASLLAMSRIIGESAALIYTMGTAISDYPRIGEGASSLAVQIWTLMSGEQPNFELSSAIAIIILVMVLALNIIVKVLSLRWQRRALGSN